MVHPPADLHIHSVYSHDSLMRPCEILKRAARAGLSVIAITDHDTIQGGVEAKRCEGVSGIRVIIGAEISTDAGDIIGLSLKEEIRSRSWQEVLSEIHDQGGISVLPHPFRSHPSPYRLGQQVDLIEVWNARSTPHENALAAALAEATGKPRLMGSDAHTFGEIGNIYVRIDPDSFAVTEVLVQRYATPWSIRWSRGISRYRNLPRVARRILFS
jgi:predicted metal-dependent phosphoesterase TrpH